MAVPPAPAPAAATTWNPTDRSPTMTLDPSLLTATAGGRGAQSIRATTAAPKGLWQAEIKAVSITPDWAVGLGTKAFPLGSGGGVGNDNMAIGFYPVSPPQSVWLNASVIGHALSLPDNGQADVTGDVIDIVSDGTSVWFSSDAMNAAFNPPAGKFVYNNDVAANPVTGVGGFPLADMGTDDRFLIANTLNNGSAFGLNSAGPFKRPVAGAKPYGASVVTPPGPTHVTVAAAINAATAARSDALKTAEAALAAAEKARLDAAAAADKAFADAMAPALADLAKLTP